MQQFVVQDICVQQWGAYPSTPFFQKWVEGKVKEESSKKSEFGKSFEEAKKRGYSSRLWKDVRNSLLVCCVVVFYLLLPPLADVMLGLC